MIAPTAGLAAAADDLHQILDQGGKLRSASPMPADRLSAAYRSMRLAHLLDTRLISLSRRDAIGTYPPIEGQEAAAVGSAFALDPACDWIVPSYREQGALLHHGLPLDNLIANYFGKPDAARIPDGVNILTRQQSIGAQISHAVGIAWGLRLRRTGGVVLAYFGDGASSEGDFHEAANLAGVQKAPVVLFLQNNGWAISVPARTQTAATSFADRAAGYGFPGVRVDGNDVLAVYAVTQQAVERARRGDGPTLIEACTYRLNVHNTADHPRRYRSAEEEESARATEPLARVRAHLISIGLADDDTLAALDAELSEQIDAAIRRVQALPRPSPRSLIEHVFADIPAQAQAQLTDVLSQTDSW
ncbi:thiamine pyrophosphate-dependent dehydrogenase E1 component subunit alpha [Pseudonocardia sp.]|jgi:pyruvate dehydrogenase E1 component alpha subunit|uniref:thiamine pyrophosphate-dependent dehydrogenase E1 component subunit alpha n=1 Tax=Pseudonocardia sp. TaxID=60912 RepID=UPI0031FDABBC